MEPTIITKTEGAASAIAWHTGSIQIDVSIGRHDNRPHPIAAARVNGEQIIYSKSSGPRTSYNVLPDLTARVMSEIIAMDPERRFSFKIVTRGRQAERIRDALNKKAIQDLRETYPEMAGHKIKTFQSSATKSFDKDLIDHLISVQAATSRGVPADPDPSPENIVAQDHQSECRNGADTQILEHHDAHPQRETTHREVEPKGPIAALAGIGENIRLFMQGLRGG